MLMLLQDSEAGTRTGENDVEAEDKVAADAFEAIVSSAVVDVAAGFRGRHTDGGG